jgi:nicotinamidase-related amidase
MTNQIHPYEPLTSQNAALVLVDHQVGLMTGVRDYSTGELKHNVVALAKAAKSLKLPIVVTTTARDSMWGPTIPELVEALPGIEIIDRSSVNAFDDARVARAIEATGRKKLIFAGISLEVCAAFPAITAVGKGLAAYVAVDASGTFSETKRQTGLLRMLQAGVVVSDYATLMVEILKDNGRPEAGEVYTAWTWAGPHLSVRSPGRTESKPRGGSNDSRCCCSVFRYISPVAKKKMPRMLRLNRKERPSPIRISNRQAKRGCQ